MLLTKVLSRSFSKLHLPATTHHPHPFNGNPQQIIAKRKKHFSNLYPLYYKNPLIITEGHLQYLYDHKGNRYLDLQSNGGQVNIGHNHPAIKKVIQDQAGALIHTSTIYMNETQGQYSKLLVEQLGSQFQSVYFCNSTSEAIDFSLMIARVFSGEKDTYAFRNGYHGLVGNARAVTNLGTWSSNNVDRNTCNRLNWPSSGVSSQAALKQVKEIVQNSSAENPGALVYEPIQGKGGVNLAPSEYVKDVVKYFKSYKAVTICDESNTGLGRIGKQNWGFKWQNHVPDIVAIGSSLGNGHPLAAVVTRKQIASVIKHNWFNTFAAGHMQTKIGIAVLKTIKAENLAENAEKIGNYLLTGLTKATQKSKFVGGVRGKGLLLGIDIVQNGEPSKDRALQVLQLARERQLLLGRGGPHGSTLLVRPPLCLSQADAKYVVESFEDLVHKLH